MEVTLALILAAAGTVAALLLGMRKPGGRLSVVILCALSAGLGLMLLFLPARFARPQSLLWAGATALFLLLSLFVTLRARLRYLNGQKPPEGTQAQKDMPISPPAQQTQAFAPYAIPHAADADSEQRIGPASGEETAQGGVTQAAPAAQVGEDMFEAAQAEEAPSFKLALQAEEEKNAAQATQDEEDTAAQAEEDSFTAPAVPAEEDPFAARVTQADYDMAAEQADEDMPVSAPAEQSERYQFAAAAGQVGENTGASPAAQDEEDMPSMQEAGLSEIPATAQYGAPSFAELLAASLASGDSTSENEDSAEPRAHFPSAQAAQDTDVANTASENSAGGEPRAYYSTDTAPSTAPAGEPSTEQATPDTLKADAAPQAQAQRFESPELQPYYDKAEHFRQNRQYALAIQLLDYCIAHEPDEQSQIRATFRLLDCLARAGRFDELRERAIKLRSTHALNSEQNRKLEILFELLRREARRGRR